LEVLARVLLGDDHNSNLEEIYLQDHARAPENGRCVFIQITAVAEPTAKHGVSFVRKVRFLMTKGQTNKIYK
jgi:hypothetical protein